MNLKNTPKPWQICVEIAISFGLTVGIAEIADLLWSAIGGGFKSFAVIVLMAIALVIIAIRIEHIVRKKELVSPVYLDVFKGCQGIFPIVPEVGLYTDFQHSFVPRLFMIVFVRFGLPCAVPAYTDRPPRRAEIPSGTA